MAFASRVGKLSLSPGPPQPHLQSPSNNEVNSAASSSVSLAPSEITLPADGKEESEESKFKQLLGVLKKAVGVKDLGAIRLSLPATLLTPIPNLEFWCYLDRPDLFAAIGDSDDPLERLIAVLRWTLSKESKFVHYGLCKPYNSVLGERFRCIYDVTPVSVREGKLEIFEDTPPDGCYLSGEHTASAEPTPNPQHTSSMAASPSSDSDDGCFHDAEDESCSDRLPDSATDQAPGQPNSLDSSFDNRPESLHSNGALATSIVDGLNSKEGTTTTAATSTSSVSRVGCRSRRARVAFLNEQVSHHPPVSCFYYESRMTGDVNGKRPVVAYGVDQISAKFTGTTVKVFPGGFNKGIFVHLPDRDEEYRITHPTANILGMLRGNPYVAISDYCFITCRSQNEKRYRVIMNYLDENWLGKPKYAVEGIIHEVDGDGKKEEDWTKIKHVPTDKIIAKFEGSWRGEVKITRTTKDAPAELLVDVASIPPLPKTVRPVSQQDEVESRRHWSEVTRAIKEKRHSEATRLKQALEQRQRDLAAQRKQAGVEFEPLYFKGQWSEEGRPKLNDQGQAALEKEFLGEGY